MEPLPTGRGASSGGGAPPYARHRPERILCHQIVEEYYPAFKAHLAARATPNPITWSKSSRATSSVDASSTV